MKGSGRWDQWTIYPEWRSPCERESFFLFFIVDNLVNADYVKHKEVEQALRAVDRGWYFLPPTQSNAYRDTAWKHGNLHLSAVRINRLIVCHGVRA